MKALSLICLLLAIGCSLAEHLGFYSMGYLGQCWRYLNPLTLLPTEFLLFILLFSGLVWSVATGKSRIWMTTLVGIFLAFVTTDFFLSPRPWTLINYGIRDHVMKVSSLDDLRNLAKDIHRDIPGISIFHGDTSSLVGQRASAYQKLKQTYPFLNWGLGSNDGPLVTEHDGTVAVEWGGALPGHWGFSVSVDGSKNTPEPDISSTHLVMSDDIYFYCGD